MIMEDVSGKIVGNTSYVDLTIDTIVHFYPFYTREDLLLLPYSELINLCQSALNTGGNIYE